jgi:hypothetical protein
MPKSSTRLQTLALDALDLAVESFSDGDQCPFVSFIADQGQTIHLDVRSAAGRIDASLVDEARSLVRALDMAARYAIAWDGVTHCPTITPTY